MSQTRWVLVTGGSRGIGRAVVTYLAEHGFEVVFTYRSNVEEAEQCVADLASKGYQVHAYPCDVAQRDAVNALAVQLIEARGAPYALVNNAGVTRDTLLMSMDSVLDWDSVINTNLTGVYNMTKAFLESMMTEGDACIVNMSSVAARMGVAGQTNYAATKAGITGLTRSLSREVARFNIRVNAVLPGFIETDMTRELDVKQIRKMIPMNRFGHGDEVASLVHFLLDAPGGRYITGQELVIDGGLLG